MIPFARSFASGVMCILIATACGSAENGGVSQASQSSCKGARKTQLLTSFNAVLEGAQATRGSGLPELWTLSDADTTIHLFGTVHLLRPEIDWRSEAFETAFANSETIVFEVDLSSEAGQRAIIRDFVSRGLYQDGSTLTAVLAKQEERVIEAALDSVGLSMSAVNNMRPWMVATQLSIMKLQADGYDSSAGVEAVLLEEAKAAGKRFAYLEQAKDQADIFERLSEDVHICLLFETAILLDESARMLDQLVDEWADGDVVGLGKLVASPQNIGGGDKVYQSLLVNRNVKWVSQIETMLAEPGTVFIAVGAGHLAGADSVIMMLRDKGYQVTGP